MSAKKRVLPMLVGLLLAGGASVAQACYWDYGGYGYDNCWGPGMMAQGMMGHGMMSPGMTGAPHGGGNPNAALSVLDERYARGEIKRDEYLRMREDLRRRGDVK